MRKVAVFFLTVTLAISLLAGNALAFSDFTNYTGNIQYTDPVDPYAVILFDADSGTILYQKNIDEQIEPASTTKILTLIVALENSNPDDIVTVSSKAANTGGSTLDLISNEKLAMKDLLNGMMMKSGNDAAIAVAEHVGGTVEDFVDMMNATAQRIGMAKSHFVTPHGLHDENHVTTARDMAILTSYAMQNPRFVEIVKNPSYTMPPDNKHSSSWTADNTNHLLDSESSYYYQYATGIKTGSTPAAGDCLVSSASKNGMNLICLIYKDEFNGSERWPLTKNLFEWGFDNFKTVDLATLLEKAEPVQATVENATASDSGILEFNAPEVGATYVTLDKDVVDGILNDTDSIVTDKALNDDPLEAPIAKDDVVGTVTYKSEKTGEIIYQGSLIASRDVARIGSEPNASGATAVETQPPVLPPEVVTPEQNPLIWLWLLLPAGLIVFLVIRLLTVNKRKRRRFKHRQPHYSYKIKKR